jgi:hypothetical protein
VARHYNCLVLQKIADAVRKNVVTNMRIDSGQGIVEENDVFV